MTTEQFLSHLGIEVEQEFRIDKYVHTYRFNKDMRLECKFWREDWHLSNNRFDDVIGHEITPLPKYTLSEDEKAIVRLEFRGENICVYRYASGRLSVKVDGNDIIDLDDDLFPFIEYEDFVSLDELRKCL